MSKKLYDRLTTGSVVFAVTSALLFERAGKYDWLVGALGILAGATAATAYFCNQFQYWRTKTKETVPHNAAANPIEAASRYSLTDVRHPVWLRPEKNHEAILVSRFERSGMAITIGTVGKFGFVRKPSHYHVVARRHLAIGRRPSDKFANQVSEIVDKLSSRRILPTFEFVLTREGNFLIRQSRGGTAWSWTMANSPETESDPFLPFPEKIN